MCSLIVFIYLFLFLKKFQFYLQSIVFFFLKKKRYLLLLPFIIIILWTNVLWNENTVSLLSKCWFTICNIVLNFTAFLENGPSFWMRLVLKRSGCVDLILNKQEKNREFRFKRNGPKISNILYKNHCFFETFFIKKNQLKFESQKRPLCGM